MQIPLLIDRSLNQSLTAQLVEQLREAIRRRKIPSGTRLPSSRELAAQLAIARNTVVRAYDELIAEGDVEAHPASGIFVADRPADELSPGAAADRPRLEPRAPMPQPWISPRSPALGSRGRGRLSFDFVPGQANPKLFPLKTWRRLMQAALSRDGQASLTPYGDPAGLIGLRSAIAHHLAANRGVIVDPACVIVTNGVQQGIDIATRLFVRPGAAVTLETPCYQGAAFAFEAAGAKLIGVGVDEEGLRADELPETGAALIYVTPSHQFPTGYCLSPSRRAALVAWARRHGCYILEDDYDSDFYYEGSPLEALAAGAPDCVIHLGTFSKSLGAGLRLGYMVVPAPIAEAATAMKALMDNGSAWLAQATLAEFLRGGSFRAHLARVRAQYRDSRDSLIESLRRHFGEVEVSGETAGLHLLWRLPAGVPDADILDRLAQRARVGIYTLAAGGAYELRPSWLSQRAAILGFASLNPKQIEQGVARLSDAVDEALDKGQIDVEALARRHAPPSYAARPVAAAVKRLAPRIRQRPALQQKPRPKARFTRDPSRETSRPMPLVKGIYRYPVKGLSPQATQSVALAAGEPFPHDRIFALARPGAPIDPVEPKWAKKGLFVMMMLDDGLADLRTHFDVETHHLRIMRGNEQLAFADLEDEGGRATVEALIHRQVPTLREPPRLVRSRGGHFSDKPENLISLINLATVRSLEDKWGYEIDPLRFRANIYIDGARPWEEFEWLGGDIKLGGATFRVDRRNGRCSATNVNPATGRRDLDIPGSLRAAFGHKDLGIYLMCSEGGVVRVDDGVEVPETTELAQDARAVLRAERAPQRRFICRGCYYIYEDSSSTGARFATLPASWRCPDCGAEKSLFRPYVAPAAAQ